MRSNLSSKGLFFFLTSSFMIIDTSFFIFVISSFTLDISIFISFVNPNRLPVVLPDVYLSDCNRFENIVNQQKGYNRQIDWLGEANSFPH